MKNNKLIIIAIVYKILILSVFLFGARYCIYTLCYDFEKTIIITVFIIMIFDILILKKLYLLGGTNN